jgi:ribosomal protein L11 methylase PrmA
MPKMTFKRAAGSHRDPGGFLFWRDEVLYRQINKSSAEAFAAFEESGLYKELTDRKMLVEHETVGIEFAAGSDASCVIKPRLIDTISYPYEWSFSQLKDAALLTLDLQERALKKNFSLKDATAYNVQFDNGHPIFIDTLSFDRYEEGKPWVAYGQFCRHFLAPLALMAHVDINLNKLLRTHIDGIPLTLAAKLLPTRKLFSPSLAMHVWMHAKSEINAQQNRDGDRTASGSFSRNAFFGIIDSLRKAITKLEWKPGGTEWFDYYEANNNYGDTGLEEKERLVGSQLDHFQPASLWDLGGNTGRFSRIAVDKGVRVVCFDIDPACVESNYLHIKANSETGLLPLLMDLGNPSPGLGWDSSERSALTERGTVDVIMALGLVHHLAIGINVSFDMIAKMFSRIGRNLIIEFVPRGDSQIDKLLSSRNDVFFDYHEDEFQEAFSAYFDIVRADPIPGTKRTLYAMATKSS